MKIILINFLFLGVLFAQPSKLDSLENVIKNDDQNIEAMFDLAKIYYNMVSKEENDVATERALNNINLPDSFDRQMYYLSDFEFIRNHPAFLTFGPDFQQRY